MLCYSNSVPLLNDCKSNSNVDIFPQKANKIHAFQRYNYFKIKNK
jgi:hypothetical protein